MNSLVKNILVSIIVLCAAPILITRTAYAEVLITEIMYDPKGGDNGHEWVEIMNDGDTPVNIQNLRFFEADTKHRIKESVGETNIVPGAVAIIAQDSAQFKNNYQTYQGAIFLSSFSLRQQNGQGELLGIYNTATNRMEHKITYAPSEQANNTGASLHLTLSGAQVAAPATPGSIAINPITAKSKVIKKEIEEGIAEEQPRKKDIKAAMSQKKDSKTTNNDLTKSVWDAPDSQQQETEDSTKPSQQVIQNQNNYTKILWVIALLLGIMVLELWIIIKGLRRRRLEMRR